MTLLLPIALAVVLSGCGTFSGLLKSDGALTAGLPTTDAPETTPVVVAAEPETLGEPVTTAADVDVVVESDAAPVELSVALEPALPERQASESALALQAQEGSADAEEDYDPWEPFNEKMFAFNRSLDRWILKPAARAYNVVMPEPWQLLISNGFSNISFVPRLINSMLQGKWGGAGREMARFLINSTAGIGGLFDPAKDYWGIEKSREDFGQTLGVWGSGPGPYIVMPFLEPLTVRDGIGKFVDGLLDPLTYLLPFFWDRLGMKAGDLLNDRALNYDLFQGFEESVIDMYSAVRHGYLQRRQQLIRE